MSMNADEFRGWLPTRMFQRGDERWLDWDYFGPRQLTEPFFSQSIAAVRRKNGDLMRQTKLDFLDEVMLRRKAIEPNGFIFHMSRCGSTLISQMLSRLPHALILSEPGPLVLSLHGPPGGIRGPEDRRVVWFKTMMRVMAEPRDPLQAVCFVKFDAWSAAYLPIIRQAFPNVPWVFVYRDPIEVMISQRRKRGGEFRLDRIDPSWLNLSLETARNMHGDEYTARAIGHICQFVVQSFDPSTAMLINYEQLPDIIWTHVLSHFRTAAANATLQAMRSAAQFDAKHPSARFKGDSEEKQLEADTRLRSLANYWIHPGCQRLEDLRINNTPKARRP